MTGTSKDARLQELRNKMAMEFPTEEALKKYLQDHPGANKSNHSVKKTEKKGPSQADVYKDDLGEFDRAFKSVDPEDQKTFLDLLGRGLIQSNGKTAMEDKMDRLSELRSKMAMEFDTEDALKKYLEDHPKADKAKHKVKAPSDKDAPKDDKPAEGDKAAPKKDPGDKPPKTKSGKRPVKSEKYGVWLDGISEKQFEKYLNDPLGKELQEKYNLKIVAGRERVITADDIKRARDVRKKMGDFSALKHADLCTVSPPVCKKNLGIERDSMPQFTNKPISVMRKALTDDRYKEILADIEKDGKGPALGALTDEERNKFFDKNNAESAIAAGADPDGKKSTFDLFVDQLKKEGVKVKNLTKKGMRVGDLHATQSEIRAQQVIKNADTFLSGKMNPDDVIYVSSDGHILDGHHRWAGILTADPDAHIPVIQVGLPMKKLLAKSFDAKGVFRQDFNFDVVDPSKPLDLARKDGETWQQKGKWYGKKGGKADGPFKDKAAAEAYASGKGKSEKKGAYMDRLAELRGKLAMEKKAFTADSAEFVEWCLLKNDRVTASECRRLLERVGLEMKPDVPSGPPKGKALDQGELVRVDNTQNTNPLNVDACEKWHDNVGTIYEVKGDHLVVQFPNGERVQFMGLEGGRSTGLYRHTPASVADKPGRSVIELIYISNTNAPPPSVSAVEMVQEYIAKGQIKGETRYDIYYSGLPASMGTSKEGLFYFKIFPTQRMTPIAGAFPRTFNPTKGKVLYMGILNRRPGGWENDLAKLRAQKGFTPDTAVMASDESALRAAVVKLAREVPEMRKHLLPILKKK